jgi:hypothetical protein
MGVFAFLLVTALMGWFYAPGSTQRTPLNVKSTTDLEGTATYLGTGPAPVQAYSKNVVNGEKSTSSKVVFTSNTCLWFKDVRGECPDAAGGPGLINAAEDTFATDRHTGLSVDKPTYHHEGLVNKFPFSAEKKTYPFWDGVLGKAVDAAFKGEESVNGFSTYKYVISVPEQPAIITGDVQGTYSDEKTMWVDPVTGSIIKQSDRQLRKLDSGATALDLDLGFTKAQVAANIKDADANRSQLRIVGLLPNIAIVGALISLVAGLLLLRDGNQATRAPGRRAAVTTA